MKDINFAQIKSAAEDPLYRLNSIQFGDKVISDDLIRCIAEAIADAIEEYDKQRKD